VFIQTETVDPECSFIRTSRERVVATGLLTALWAQQDREVAHRGRL